MGPGAARVLVVADTHLTASNLDRMPAEVWDLADRADVVLHAGDITDPSVLDAIAERAPVRAVLGNNDQTLQGQLPSVLQLELGGVALAMVHDAGPAAGRARRMRRRFPEAQVVIFGHSHQPMNASPDGQLLFNPGSPTQRRRQPVHTVGWLELRGGTIAAADIVEVGPLADRFAPVLQPGRGAPG